MSTELTVSRMGRLFTERIAELQEEPEFQRVDSKRYYVSNEDGTPQLKLAMGNMPVGYDLWEDLRNPAVVGLHPAGLPVIWEFHANRRKQQADESSMQRIFKIPRSFEYALSNYKRAVIVSVMLPFSYAVVHDYVGEVIDKKNASSHLFARMNDYINCMLDKAVTRVAIQLASADAEDVVVAMNKETVKAVSNEAVPQTRQGISHGPSKGGNYPQKSVAALMGLGQFGVSRLVFRDEINKGKVHRFAGPIRSIIVFDKQPMVTDGSDGIMYPSKAWRQFLMRLSDFTDLDAAVNEHRFCAYIPQKDGGCSKCIENCPSGAQSSSVPRSDGLYSDQVSRQAHRFWKGKLQFDFNKCQDDRRQLAELYPEWSCARCLTVCLDHGIRRKQAAASFYSRIAELVKGEVPAPMG